MLESTKHIRHRKSDGLYTPCNLSVTINYNAALWDMWIEVALLHKDDAELVQNLQSWRECALQVAPTGWDLIMAGTSLGIHATDESLRVSPRLFQQTFSNRPTRCGHAILWGYNGATNDSMIGKFCPCLAALPLIKARHGGSPSPGGVSHLIESETRSLNCGSRSLMSLLPIEQRSCHWLGHADPSELLTTGTSLSIWLLTRA